MGHAPWTSSSWTVSSRVRVVTAETAVPGGRDRPASRKCGILLPCVFHIRSLPGRDGAGVHNSASERSPRGAMPPSSWHPRGHESLSLARWPPTRNPDRRPDRRDRSPARHPGMDHGSGRQRGCRRVVGPAGMVVATSPVVPGHRRSPGPGDGTGQGCGEAL